MEKYIQAIGIQNIDQYLFEQGILNHNEQIQDISVPGEGNMNLVLRLKTNQNRSIILKKSFKYVKKYPQVKAPINRLSKEFTFYDTITLKNNYFPHILGFDNTKHILLQSDLGETKDYSAIYQSHQLNETEINQIFDFLLELHQAEQPAHFENKEMQQLNHEHIFVIPFLKDNGIDLNQFSLGLQEFSQDFKSNIRLPIKAKALGNIYLSKGDYLLHGDYYPGSWLQTKNGFKVIDPEFCFFGPVEFDLGVCIAHLKMAEIDYQAIEQGLARYMQEIEIDKTLLRNFIGVEIIRRLLGVAQLPITLSLQGKIELLEEAKKMMME